MAGFNNVPLSAPFTGQQTDIRNKSRTCGCSLNNNIYYIFELYKFGFSLDNLDINKSLSFGFTYSASRKRLLINVYSRTIRFILVYGCRFPNRRDWPVFVAPAMFKKIGEKKIPLPKLPHKKTTDGSVKLLIILC